MKKVLMVALKWIDNLNENQKSGDNPIDKLFKASKEL